MRGNKNPLDVVMRHTHIIWYQTMSTVFGDVMPTLRSLLGRSTSSTPMFPASAPMFPESAPMFPAGSGASRHTVLGVQWHPEMLIGPVDPSLTWLVERAREFADTRQRAEEPHR